MNETDENKKKVLSLMFSEGLFHYIPDGWNDFILMEFADKNFNKPFLFYEQNFQHKTQEEIKALGFSIPPRGKDGAISDMTQDSLRSSSPLGDLDNKIDEDKVFDLFFYFQEKFDKFTRAFLNMNEFSPNKPTLEELFLLFEDVYNTYQRYKFYWGVYSDF